MLTSTKATLLCNEKLVTSTTLPLGKILISPVQLLIFVVRRPISSTYVIFFIIFFVVFFFVQFSVGDYVPSRNIPTENCKKKSVCEQQRLRVGQARLISCPMAVLWRSLIFRYITAYFVDVTISYEENIQKAEKVILELLEIAKPL